MMRQICWVERGEDGVKREVRVAVQQGRVKWQFKRDDQERWDYDGPASQSDWDLLLEKMENRYQRRNVSYDDLAIVRRAYAEARQPPV